MSPEWVGTYFGEPWPSGICDDGVRVAVPVGRSCALCQTDVVGSDRGSFVGIAEPPYFGPVHRECSLRSALGGIGHLQDHAIWCVQKGDPDAGLDYRQSALAVWEWVAVHGF
jgi:hypothetical protein